MTTSPTTADKRPCIAAQVRHSRLTVDSTGYRLQSVDRPTDVLVVGFDGHACVENSSDTPAEQTYDKDGHSVVIHAVAGIFKLEQHSYMLVVTDSSLRGTINDKSIYEVTAVCALPLDYDHGDTVFQTLLHEQSVAKSEEKNRVAAPRKSFSTSDVAGLAAAQAVDGNGVAAAVDGDAQGFKWLSPQITRMFRPSSSAESGEFRAATAPRADSRGSDGSAGGAARDTDGAIERGSDLSAQRKTDMTTGRMETRVVEEIVRVFSTSGMFYSYDYDLTRSQQAKAEQEKTDKGNIDELLACSADRDYWFNWHMQLALRDGCTAWALPLVQGSVQIERCALGAGDAVQISVVSRRSWRRIGLRYERRGADSDGYVANFVETEQIVELDTSQGRHSASFVQTRGSMPVLWRQRATGLHPAAEVVGSDDTNAAACARHLQREIARSGRQVLVSLVEHSGREAAVGAAFAGAVGRSVSGDAIDARMVRYVPWDFHHETRGMRYDNVQQLVAQLRGEIAAMGYSWRAAGAVLAAQRGVFRVNCMDCLDRTNVVQSAVARAVLNEQLVRLGVHAAPELGLAAHAGLEPALSRMWANNGDCISRQYAGTSAMKGDFTRTGRRNIGGIVNDATYSLARLWISTFRDYFSQAVLDFLVGHHAAAAVFRTLVDLRSREPDHARQLACAREAAVRASVAIAVRDGERVQIACIVQTPSVLDSLKLSSSAADSVLVLTDAAIYVCCYCERREKVSEFLRVALAELAAVQYGAYVTDTRTPQSLDPSRNHGLVLSFAPAPGQHSSDAEPASALGADSARRRFIACKVVSEAQVVMQHALEADDAGQHALETDDAGQHASGDAGQQAPDGSAQALVRMPRLETQASDLLTECLCSAMLSLKLSIGDTSSQFITDAPIISAAAAKQSKTLVEKMSNRLHSALWI
ncbi:hypothetical protein IWW50_005174 [Coemansia erecta]|nr:hypothetical protein IWW50_005174 [Coemansia erecta]